LVDTRKGNGAALFTTQLFLGRLSLRGTSERIRFILRFTYLVDTWEGNGAALFKTELWAGSLEELIGTSERNVTVARASIIALQFGTDPGLLLSVRCPFFVSGAGA